MTQEEIIEMARQAGFERLGHDDCDLVCYPEELEAFAKLVAEKAIKETLAQPEKEPLEYWNAVEGWVKIDEVREHFDSVGCGTIYKTAGEDRTPLYTTPPQREWVGLTHEEHMEIMTGNMTTSSRIAAAEAKLRSKNNG